MKKNSFLISLLPIFFGFFIMGFVDVVGIATSYVKDDFGLSESISGFLPSMVFIWFLLFSIPSARLMNKIGRKNTVMLSMVITLLGMSLPIFTISHLNMYVCFIAFALLGIGNTILQVSLNPLVSNLVSGKTLTSSLTVGQVIKAISAFCGPFIALFSVKYLGSWVYIFPIFGGITFIAGLWLLLTPVKKEESNISASMGDAFKLLGDRTIFLYFLGILAVVGVDVGVNMISPKILMERLGLTLQEVGYAPSIYFACRTIGAFIGSALLLKINTMQYFKFHILLGIAAFLLLIFAPGKYLILILIGVIGYAFSSIFSIIFSLAMQARPDKANEISGLMVTAICGGAIFPPLMTWATSAMNGKQTGAVIVLLLISCYLLFLSLKPQSKKLTE